jgi:hypothetical protein
MGAMFGICIVMGGLQKENKKKFAKNLVDNK